MSNNYRRRRNSCSRPLKPLEQDIGKAIAHLEVKETKEAQEYSSRNTNPDEPHKVRKGEVIETEITQCEKAIKESILKNNEILNSLNDPDDVLAAKLTAPIEKFRKLQPEMSKLEKQRYATALERSQHHRKTRVDTTKAYFKKSWKDGLNESLMRMRSRYDFRKLSYDQKEQLFNALPILNAVEEGDADKLHIFLESKCVHYANGTTGKACPCVGLTTIFDKKRRDFVEGNILVFAGANLKYQFLEDLIIRLDTTKNQHLEMLMRNWLRDYDKILLEVLFYDSEHDGYDQNDQTMTLQVLTNRRYRTLTNFSCSYSHIFSYPHKNDYQCSSVDQSYLSYATSNKQWAVVADFLSNLGVDKACRELIPQFLVDLVYTKEAANIRRILTDFWVPWTNRLYEDKRETLSEADRKYLCFPTLIEQYGMKGANGETCFHAAVLVGNREILSTVLKTVKSVLSRFKCHELFLHEFTNMEGQTALDLAIALGQKEMAEALWEHMYRPEILTNSRLFDTVGDYANLLDGKKDLTGLVHRFIHSVLTRVQPDYNVRLDRINLAYGQTPMLTILVVLEEFDLAHTLLKYYGLMFKYGTDQYILDDLDGALTHFPRRSRNNDSKEEDEFIKKRLDLYACLLAAGARYHQLGSSFKILKDSHTQEDLVLFYNDFMANKKEAARTGITLNHVVPEVFEDAAGNLRLGFISP